MGVEAGLVKGHAIYALKVQNFNNISGTDFVFTYRAFHKLPQIYTANHATFPIQMYAITVWICGNF